MMMMESGSELAHEVLDALRGISRRLDEHSKRLSEQSGLTLPQFMCIEAIGAAAEPPTLALLADGVHLSSATVSRIVERLVKAGFVDRTRGIVDRRQVQLRLTPRGQELHGALPVPLQEHFLSRLRQLPRSEREGLVAALRRIAELMETDASTLAPPRRK